jgi:hypothetical protein
VSQTGTGGFVAVGTYGFSDDKLYPLKAPEILQSGKDVQLKFLTGADSLVIVNSNADGTFVGTIKYVNAQPKGIKFEKSVVAAASASTTGPAQSGSATGAALDRSLIKLVLLNPNGFDVASDCGNRSGRSHLTFKEENGKIKIDIDNFSYGNCTSEAKLTNSGAAFDGCRDTGIAISFDANNKEIPFKGRSARCSYDFKARLTK